MHTCGLLVPWVYDVFDFRSNFIKSFRSMPLSAHVCIQNGIKHQFIHGCVAALPQKMNISIGIGKQSVRDFHLVDSVSVGCHKYSQHEKKNDFCTTLSKHMCKRWHINCHIAVCFFPLSFSHPTTDITDPKSDYMRSLSICHVFVNYGFIVWISYHRERKSEKTSYHIKKRFECDLLTLVVGYWVPSSSTWLLIS